MDGLKQTLKPMQCCGDVLLVMILFSSPVLAETVYRIAIVPQYNTRITHIIWRPILNALEDLTGMRLELRGTATIPAFEQELSNYETPKQLGLDAFYVKSQ